MKNAAFPTTRRSAFTFKKTFLGIAGFVLLVPFAAHSQDAHEHGLADLRVALDGGTLLIEFESPMDNLVGFEHAPSTDAQRQALAAAEARLRDSTTLFVLPAAASCVQTDLQLESPYPQQDDDHDHGHDDHGHEHDDHGHKHDDHAHADMYVVYQFECADPAALDGLEVKLIEAFPRTHTIRAQVAAEAGQASVRLSKHEDRLSF